MTFVFDASPLIYLGKVKLLHKVAILDGKKYMPPAVYTEVVINGLERREPEAQYIDELIRKKCFSLADPKLSIGAFPFLSKADHDVLSLAKEMKAICIVDEIYANDIAETFK